MKNWAKKGRGISRVTYFLILGQPYYLRLGWSYRRQILQPDRGWRILNKKWKIGPKSGVAWVTWPTFEFWDPYYLRLLWSYKRQILQPDRGQVILNNKRKIGPKAAWSRSRDLLLNFGTPLLSLVRMKLQTSNIAGGLRLRGTKQRNKNDQSGHCLWHVTCCFCLEPISIRRPTRLTTVNLVC